MKARVARSAFGVGDAGTLQGPDGYQRAVALNAKAEAGGRQ
ncbi:hypothetical protein QTH91_16205 [Variovorax dokdonensis]|uniref:Uncharacterized protein n=1 Tax=Variovorax dokdonensis TaxID=344883 RepID=A0ABT7NDL2_9BURK|nr:hypothetical protein [Variovorax dokdonensis]MDM0046033.1 hypothetical protein [Variovorax dokdonensis]